MSRSKISQKKAVFYILYKSRKVDPLKYVSPFEVDIGDVFIEPLGKYVFTSWKTPARLSDLFTENPDLLERISVKSKSGSHYYQYRIRVGVKQSDILDEELKDFYLKIKK